MKKVFIFLTFFLLISSGIVTSVFAQDNTKDVVLQKNEIVDHDYFASGGTVTVLGTVNGDSYIAGGTIYIDGTINGDLLVAGGTINIRGKVKNDIRAAGGTITISGNVGGNVTVTGGTVTITDSTIDGSLVAGAGTLTISSPIGKGATIGGGTVMIASEIGGPVVAGVGTATLRSGTNIKGDFTYWSNEKVVVDPDASVSGKLTQNIPPQEKSQEKAKNAAAGFFSFFKIVDGIGSFIFGLLLLSLAPFFFQKTTLKIRQKPWISFLVGLVALIVTPIIIILLLITLIGIPISLMLLALFFIALYISKLFIAYVIGDITLSRIGQKPKPWIILLVGLILYWIITWIPLFGGIISFIVVCMGFGALLLEKKEYYQLLKSKKMI